MSKRRKISRKGRDKIQFDRLFKMFCNKFSSIQNKDKKEILRLYLNNRDFFEGKKMTMYFLTINLLEFLFITTNTHQVKSNENEEFQKRDWKLLKFFKDKACKAFFPSISQSFEKPLTANQTELLDGLQNIFKRFDLKAGGTNRKILLFLLYEEGVSAKYLGDFAGVTANWVRKTRTKTTDKEIETFFQRFFLKRKICFQREKWMLLQRCLI